jgi:serine/threonine-protein kinase PpkA
MDIPGYEIKRLIGQGGMATAYLATQISLGRAVVLKVLDRDVAATPETIERFLNEGRIIASLNHPHIITIYDIGESQGKVYISMEYVEGGDLKQRLQQQVFAPAEAIEIIESIAAALNAAHANGIVHRDVKPGNILFRKDGTPLLSDFGIAKRLSGDFDLTSTGMFVGSPNYMAPEQSESGPIDGRADIYALGVIFYEMLTGERAYAAASVIDVILMHKQAPVPTLPAGLESYQELLNLMMAKARNERFRDARSLLHFIAQMRRSGVIRSPAQMTARPDVDVTDERNSSGQTNTRLSIGRAPPSRLQRALTLTLMACLVIWTGLLAFERYLARAPTPQAMAATPPPALNPALPAGGDLTQVEQALLWLGRHSLAELRLTAPPRDNAYYYFSRLLQLDPTNAAAQDGLAATAAQFALLAERALANDDPKTARGFVAIGLEIDPGNQNLLDLRGLTSEVKVGFWDALTSLFE